MPLPLDPRNKPATVKVHVSSGAGVDIVWADGHQSHYDFAYLRDHCPCASCNDDRAKKEALEGISKSNQGFSPLPMFKPKPRAQSAAQIGNYAIQIFFTDGHSTGIYSYDHLRSICPCPVCSPTS
jgi:DUF971 family protein